MTTSSLFHLLPLGEYHADTARPITAASLETEGFVHCSPDPGTALAVANELYRSAEEQLVLVELDPSRLSAPVRWEPPSPKPPEGVSARTLFPHVYGPLEREAVRGLRYARRDVHGRFVAFETRGLTAQRLDLLPHPEGGWYRRTWTSPVELGSGRASRPSATAIHYLLAPGEFSRWHAVRSDELWMWHSGSPLRLSTAGRGSRPGESPDTVTLGTDLAAGQHPQSLVPAGTWQCAEPVQQREVLVSCVVSPGFDFADFEVCS
ncbi:cupin domain-containing protein [Actinopolyspora mortivallis]|uniref:cupin domain-containing protein n=1 Tax=Actinopolyspora mortivallis TaxID=33906 RepID=UPI00036D6DC1|nr:cupin domain-containing protein [Actinopolyspora mortivallis]